jgi:hypothetical protein
MSSMADYIPILLNDSSEETNVIMDEILKQISDKAKVPPPPP